LHNEADQKHTQLVRNLGQVCRDLEERCNTAEQPLREQRARSEALEEQLGALRGEVEHLQSESDDREFLLKGLESEKSQLEVELERADTHNSTLSSRIDELERSLEAHRKLAADETKAMQDKFDAEGLEHRAEVASRNEAFEDVRAELSAKQQETSHLQEELIHLQSDLQAAKSEVLAQAAALNQSEQDLVALKAAHEHAKSDAASQDEKLQSMMIELQSRQSEFHEAQRAVQDLESQHNDTTTALKDEIERLTAAHAAHTEQLRRQAKDEHKALALRISDLQREKESAQGELQTTMQLLRQSNEVLLDREKELEKLSTTFGEKDAELAELQHWRQNLMSAMGNAPLAPALGSKRTSTLRRTTSIFPAASSSRRSVRLSKTIQDAEDSQVQSPIVADRSFESSASSAGGPTPKRLKPRKSFKVPAVEQPSVKHGTTPDQGRRTTLISRQPLMDVSKGRANQSPSKLLVPGHKAPQYASPRKHVVVINPMEDDQEGGPEDDEDFDASALFTSTPLTIRQGTTPAKSFYDGTTQDI